MKTIFKLSYALALSAFLWTTAAGQSLRDLPKSETFAVEISGVLCGYAESEISTTQVDGKEFLVLKRNILAKLSALGGGVDMTIQNKFLFDPKTDKPVSIEHVVATSAEIYTNTKFENGKAFFTDSRNGEFREIELDEDVIVENSINYPHLMKDFIKGKESEKSYRVFDDMKGVVATKSYRLLGKEVLELNGEKWQTTLLEEVNREVGTTTKLWLNDANSELLKLEVAGRLIYLADESVKKDIQTVDMESMLFARVNKMIPNIPDISYMKVEASILSGGEWITQENLNFPGQKFSGTVTNNLIEGVFEIEPFRYRGENAPSFPASFSEERLKRYLGPEKLIESDNPVLIAEAKKITSGSENSWEAAVRLSKWVSDNIRGAVPGGTSAINTYNTREGECGSHSRLLTAFCRTVGIPARLSVGCMYTPYLGGSFGQHAWTEVYMGDVGWVAIDATAREFDFIDAGHIRLGEAASFNPKSMKILQYKMGSGKVADQVPKELAKYIGKYLFEEKNSIFEILYRDGSLAVNIPGSQVLALYPPDEKGIMYPKLTREINFSFNEDLYGNIAKMKLQQVFLLPKKSEPENIDENVPEELRTLLGVYLFPQPQSEFEVLYKDGMLAFNNPLANQVIKLPHQNDEGVWIDESKSKEIEFVKDGDGSVIRMIISINLYMPKQTEI
ncbi:transglutaminase-like domain-containing protein [Maribellus sediminis]|uniref:transglutaminase-like domain-containing protein n=1 Tax=Maribellus sediminis TaxID=2696285 RepID=UPI0014302603|nr:transglutaminase-like domain-containing protein [Maribellus sediminis]